MSDLLLEQRCSIALRPCDWAEEPGSRAWKLRWFMSEAVVFALSKIQPGGWVPVELVGKAGVLWGGLWSTRRVVHQPCPQEAAGLLRSAKLSEGDVHKSTGRRTSVHQAGEGVRGRDARTLQLTSQMTYPASRRTLVIGLRSSPRAYSLDHLASSVERLSWRARALRASARTRS